jgi:hypothetical protein
MKGVFAYYLTKCIFNLQSSNMKYLFILLTPLIFASCDWAKDKVKKTAHKSGEIIAETGSEFADGASNGIENTFSNDVVISEELKKGGLKTGKITVHGTDSSTDNIITAYLIFDNAIDRNISVKVFDGNGQEYGRAMMAVKGQKNEAKYVDFVFDKRTNINSKGKITFE